LHLEDKKGMNYKIRGDNHCLINIIWRRNKIVKHIYVVLWYYEVKHLNVFYVFHRTLDFERTL